MSAVIDRASVAPFNRVTALRAVLHNMPPNPFVAPKPARGVVVFEWNTDCTVPVICHLEHTPADRGSWQGGQQMEPDYPEDMTLCAAYVNGADIYDLLSEKQVRHIEEAALIDMHERAYED